MKIPSSVKKIVRSKHARVLGVLLLLAFIFYPTGTPEDLFTTVPLLVILGVKNYLVFLFLIAFGLILVSAWQNKERGVL